MANANGTTTQHESGIHRSVRRLWRRYLIHLKTSTMWRLSTIVAGILVAVILGALIMIAVTGTTDGDTRQTTAESASSVKVEAVTPVNVTKAPGSTPNARGEASMPGVALKTCEADGGDVTIKGTVDNRGDQDLVYRNYVTIKTDKAWYRVQVDTGAVKAGGHGRMDKTLHGTPVSGKVSSCAVYTETTVK